MEGYKVCVYAIAKDEDKNRVILSFIKAFVSSIDARVVEVI